MGKTIIQWDEITLKNLPPFDKDIFLKDEAGNIVIGQLRSIDSRGPNFVLKQGITSFDEVFGGSFNNRKPRLKYTHFSIFE